ncbi:carboxylesterase family protein [Streptomyces sp. NPDC085481]|uniref:carboxylesterase family protein n=1 Tax=Streptomyces sp. NPDC085481 TaxID=3365727 RepID=UPI0037D25495
MSGRTTVVAIRQGRLRGVADGPVSAFRGIPYAASPVGRLRFRPPVAHPGWGGVRDAAEAGPAVPQAASRLAAVMGEREADWDEDGCLRLNVWTPGDAIGGRRPRAVLVWYHGGGFTSGSGGWDWYDGARLAAAGDIVVLTANYRVGALGYLRLPEVGADTQAAFGAGVETLADACAALGTPAHVYRFTRISTAVPGLGAPHCSDLPFAFDNLDAYASAPMLGPVGTGDRALARSFSGALAAFTATGDPGWPAYRPDPDPYVHRFGTAPDAERGVGPTG